MSMSKITHIVCHYSATYADQNLTVKDIDAMHRARGWRGVGYHHVIRRDGIVEPGRPEYEVGAHVGGQNSGKIGICCIGGTERATGPNVGVDNRTPAQIEAQIKLIRELLKRYPGAQIVGHRDLAPTQCPGFDVATWWAGVQHKKRPEAVLDVSKLPARTKGVGEDRVHVVEPGETWFGIAREHGIPLERLFEFNGGASVLHPGRVLALMPLPQPAPKEITPSAPAPAAGWFAGIWNFFTRLFSKGN